MEHFEFSIDGNPKTAYKNQNTIVGVVASGNLEVLLETVGNGGTCSFCIDTAAHGFEASWHAVAQDFVQLHKAGNLRISINDNAASPAVVSLRLAQALEELDS